MKIYSVLIKKNSQRKVTDLVFLKEGFSYPAFFFNGLWFLYHKMWREFLALTLVNYLLSSSELLPKFDQAFLLTALVFIVAFNANYWRLEHLKRKGYEFIDLACGIDCDEAKFNFIKESNLQFDESILDPKSYHKFNPRKFFS